MSCRKKHNPFKMRRNLKFFLIVASLWAGGLIYYINNGAVPRRKVRPTDSHM